MRAAILLLAALAPAAQAQRAAAAFADGPSNQLVAGDSEQLHATAFDSNGNPISGAAFTWSVSDNTVLTVDASGNVHAITLGWADVFADTTGARATMRIEVTPLNIVVHPANAMAHVGDQVQYSADVLDVNSQPLPGVTLQWKAFGPNLGTNSGIGITQNGLALAYGFGSYYIEASYTYSTIGSGPFVPKALGNTMLTVLQPNQFTQTKLFDSSAVRSSFRLRERRGQLSVNDAGQIAYVGWLEGFATAALVNNHGAFTPVAVASNSGEFPGYSLLDIDDMAINNNGEVSTRCMLAPYRNCMLFAGNDGIARLVMFDGSSGGGVTNIRNFATTRFGLNDNSTTLMRADYETIGSSTFVTGLFLMTPNGVASPKLQPAPRCRAWERLTPSTAISASPTMARCCSTLPARRAGARSTASVRMEHWRASSGRATWWAARR